MITILYCQILTKIYKIVTVVNIEALPLLTIIYKNQIMRITVKTLTILLLIFSFQSAISQEYLNMSVDEKDIPIRELRRNAITGNIGWNGLTGFGVTYNHFLTKQLETDLGIGVASTGLKLGGRVSYLFLPKNFSPFVSGGFMYGLGFGDTELEDPNNGNFHYTIDPSPFLQICGGVEYMSNGGFLIRGNIGYAILLKDTNYNITKGVPTTDELRIMDAALGSGIVIEFSIGFAFGNSK